MHNPSCLTDSAAAVSRTSLSIGALPGGSACRDAVWEAVRYLCDEMSAAESDVFETRLADDLDAATALADAVLLLESLRLSRVNDSESIRISLSPAGGGANDPTSRRLPWFAAVASAVTLLIAGWYAGSRAGRPSDLASDHSLDAQASGAPQLLADSGTELDTVLSVWVELNATRDVHAAEESTLDSTFPANTDADVPDWMFAALENPSIGAENLLDGANDDELIQESSL